MSDHGHHDPGGHELEAINTKLLFRLLVSLSFITFLACLVVVQWFYRQRRELDSRHAAEGSYQLQRYKTKMVTNLEGVDRVAQDIAANPALLAAPPPPSGWVHPDDLVGGVATEVTPEPEPAEPEPEPEPAEVEPVPVELPPDDAEGEDAAPEPVEPVEPAKQPKSPEPADGEDAPKQPKQPKSPKPADEGEDAPKQPKSPKPADDGE
jgi:hypothetical protein